MKKVFSFFAFVAVVSSLYGFAGTSTLSSAKEATGNAYASRAAVIEAATNGK